MSDLSPQSGAKQTLIKRAAASSETSAVMSCRQLSDRVPFGSDPAVFQVEDNENEHRAGDHLLEPLRFL
jgi:hypothetical protein